MAERSRHDHLEGDGLAEPPRRRSGALTAHFPELLALPRVALGSYPSPVERVEVGRAGALWLKRDDLNAPVAAGNKVRALEFLLGPVGRGDLVLTAGGEGSTHVYATAVHAARLGARTVAVRWRHDMHDQARGVAAAAEARCGRVHSHRWAVTALLQVGAWRAGLARASTEDGVSGSGVRHYVPIGGSSPLGVLGHVDAGLELAAQIAAGEMPAPTHVVVPLGSGGTAAGVAIGLGLGGQKDVVVVAARVAPRAVANAARVELLMRRTLRLLRRWTRRPAPLSRPAAVVIEHGVYGGAYGRPLAAGAEAVALLRGARPTAPGQAAPQETRAATLDRAGTTIARPIMLDATYSAKAAAAAISLASRVGATGCVLLWLTFDGRIVPPRPPNAGDER